MKKKIISCIVLILIFLNFTSIKIYSATGTTTNVVNLSGDFTSGTLYLYPNNTYKYTYYVALTLWTSNGTYNNNTAFKFRGNYDYVALRVIYYGDITVSNIAVEKGAELTIENDPTAPGTLTVDSTNDPYATASISNTGTKWILIDKTATVKAYISNSSVDGTMINDNNSVLYGDASKGSDQTLNYVQIDGNLTAYDWGNTSQAHAVGSTGNVIVNGVLNAYGGRYGIFANNLTIGQDGNVIVGKATTVAPTSGKTLTCTIPTIGIQTSALTYVGGGDANVTSEALTYGVSASSISIDQGALTGLGNVNGILSTGAINILNAGTIDGTITDSSVMPSATKKPVQGTSITSTSSGENIIDRYTNSTPVDISNAGTIVAASNVTDWTNYDVWTPNDIKSITGNPTKLFSENANPTITTYTGVSTNDAASVLIGPGAHFVIFNATTTLVPATVTIYVDNPTNANVITATINGIVGDVNTNVPINESILITPPIAKSGMAFDYWEVQLGDDYTASQIGILDPTIENQHITIPSVPSVGVNLIAHYVAGCDVIFVKDDGITPIGPVQHLNVNDSPIAPVPPAKIGYTFTGWTGGGSINIISNDVNVTQVTSSTTYVAVYTPNLNSVNFLDINGNPIGIPQDVFSGDLLSSVPLPIDIPLVDGYTFSGWKGNNYLDATQDTIANTPIVGNISGIINYTAVYVPNKNLVQFNDYDNKSVNSQIVSSGSAPQTPLSPVRPGYVFNGWGLSSTNVINPSVPVIKNTYITQYIMEIKVAILILRLWIMIKHK